ncbi:hypothetical protein PO878_00405 [Iamia majanohamensis]|uniref:Cytochrome c oxidase polypeptide IV n=1 Tax=Iamia majanohamensis TaxID=467976 RepID=A0AAE9YG51_9ACTN|nr:hypothetical protein [Iamia majanohamensis]WCO67181.1 hypothetical protein PO878_00405 [Iamia majanohamensis]
MLTTGSKWFFGLAAAAFAGALVYGGATNPSDVGMDTFTGVLTFGYKGGVGDHLGYAVLMSIAGASLFLGATTAAFRDASVEAEAQLLERETVPEVLAPAHGSYWPVIGAFGAGCLVVGLVTTSLLVILGFLVLGAVVFEWGISAWAEKATGDDAVNRSIRRRVMMPVEVPVLGALGIAVFVLAVSRMLLALPKLGVYLLFGLVPLAVLIVAFALSARPRINRSLVAGLCIVGGVAVLAGGVVSTAVGPREIEEHHEEEESEGAPLLAPDAPVTATAPGTTR